MSEVVVVIGAGSIGQAIARRVSAGQHVLLADIRSDNADAAAGVLDDAGFQTSTTSVDVSRRESVLALLEQASGLGEVTRLVHSAGASVAGVPGPHPPGSTCTAPHRCSRSSARSWLPAAPGW